jgi:cytochrome c5
VVAGLLLLTGCNGGQGGEAAESGKDWREEQLRLGQETYRLACASCHDTGKLEAPLTGNPKDWSGRSDLWDAVLSEHAKAGYLEMPGKGGRPELTEKSVDAATEYMLSLTFPDRPRD